MVLNAAFPEKFATPMLAVLPMQPTTVLLAGLVDGAAALVQNAICALADKKPTADGERTTGHGKTAISRGAAPKVKLAHCAENRTGEYAQVPHAAGDVADVQARELFLPAVKVPVTANTPTVPATSATITSDVVLLPVFRLPEIVSVPPLTLVVPV